MDRIGRQLAVERDLAFQPIHDGEAVGGKLLRPTRLARYMISMVKSLELAIAEVANLPDADQEQIGRRLLSHLEKLRQLRDEVDKGIRSLDAGEGTPLDVEDFLRHKNERHDRG